MKCFNKLGGWLARRHCYRISMLHMDLALLLRTHVAYGIAFAIAYPCCIRDLPCYCLPLLHKGLAIACPCCIRDCDPLPPCLSFLPVACRCLLLYQGYRVKTNFHNFALFTKFTKYSREWKFVVLQHLSFLHVWILILGVSVSLNSLRYIQTYFSSTPHQPIRSGLPSTATLACLLVSGVLMAYSEVSRS